jgi:GAF domain-containing protein
MNFWKKINPFNMPEHIATKGDLFIIREKILQSLLLFFIIGGIPTALLASIQSIQNQQYFLAAFYMACYVLIATTAFLRHLPYAFRGYFLTAVIFFMAASELFESGQLGEVRMFLIAFTSVTAVLFDYRSVIRAMLISLMLIASAGIYISLTPNPILPALANLNSGSHWVIGSTTFVMISTIIAGSITIIISGLGKNIAKQAELAKHLQQERSALEERINERTNSMSRRMTQQRAVVDISRAASALNDPEIMLQQVVELVKDRFELYYVGIFLLDSSRQYAVLRAGTGDAGSKMIGLGHQLSVNGSSMIGWSITNRKPAIALDVGTEAVRFNNPHLPLTRSEMALPISVREHILGAMTIQSDKSNAFDEDDISILENIADGLAIALENDQLYHETRTNLEEIRLLNREYLQRVWAETLETHGELSYDFQNPNASTETTEQKTETIELPLLLRDEIIGTITLELGRPALTADETTFVENVTTQAAIALENARLLHETERRAIQEQKLNELAAGFSRAVTIDEIIRLATQELGQMPTVAEVSVQLSPAGQAIQPLSPSKLVGSGNGKEHGA